MGAYHTVQVVQADVRVEGNDTVNKASKKQVCQELLKKRKLQIGKIAKQVKSRVRCLNYLLNKSKQLKIEEIEKNE